MANGNSAVESLAKILRDLGEKHMHRYRNLLLIFFQAKLLSCRQELNCTQEAMAQHLGVTPQAVSKWERGAATPDISMLPAISAYFGVTIDELFALSDDTRMDRIQNMIWDVRYFDPADVEKERQFLLEKGRREPENDDESLRTG